MISVVILSAGQGSRMKSSTPKVLHKLSGSTLIEYVLKASLEISDDVHIVLYHQQEKIQKFLNDKFKNKLSVHTQDYENFPGTAGALMNIKVKHKKTLILNGDMPMITKDNLIHFLNIKEDVAISSMIVKNPTGYGRVICEKDKVLKIIEEKDANDDIKKINLVNAGAYLFDTKILHTLLKKIDNNNSQKEYYLTSLIELCLKNGTSIYNLIVEEKDFKGVNNKYELSVADEDMQQRIKKRWMIKGVIFENSSSSYCENDVIFEEECIIESGAIIRGNTIIKNSHIKANSVIEDAFIENSSIGPMARIRPNSKIISSGIGNFVEIKNSSITKAKAGHLSYIGDAFISEGTNIGAGFITCNYDGKSKYKTKIGKNVFVGSNTSLIAPIEIEDDVIIGAGSVLSKNALKGSLVFTRANMISKNNYYYKFFNQ